MSGLPAMASTGGNPSPAKNNLARWRVIAGVTLAPVAFAAQVVASYVIAANMCATTFAPAPTLVIVNVTALAITASGLIIAILNFRATVGEKAGGQRHVQEIGEGRTRFLAYCGLCASGIFGLAVIVQLTSILTLSTCLGTASFT